MFRRILPPQGPPRVLAQAQLAGSVGDGAFIVCSALFFTRIVGLSPAQVGFGLTLGWAVGSMAGVPLGHLADRRGPRGTAILLAAATAVAVGSFLLVRSPWAFTVAACFYASCQCGLAAARQALLAGLVDRRRRSETRAYLQSTANGGLAIGAALGGVALQLDDRTAYLAMFVMDAASFLVTALVLRRLPVVPTAVPSSPPSTAPSLPPSVDQNAGPSDAPSDSAAPVAPAVAAGGPRFAVLRDRPYALVAFLNMIMLLYMPLLSLVLPLWIVSHTAAPHWTVSALLVVNTVSVVLFQVRVARRVTGLRTASRLVRHSGVVMLAACAVFALSAAGTSAWVAGAVLLAGAVLQVIGEMTLSAGAWEIGFDLAPSDKQGQYQGFFGSGVAIARMLGPLLLTTLIMGWGAAGWLLLGGVFLLAGVAMGPAVRWAERTRTPQPEAPEDTAREITPQMLERDTAEPETAPVRRR
ncbi:MFS transporter [Microtetraspora sp. AC03309]|uniref:MFS transporter n=1 Tax=Microtetraspora sp. AC03309 TaxID=2779376 RepID=UPI001E53F462|nr:MFS transporter [Microtetraspora sp. AC03309]MCC5576217.1 MFS transporter [Microtetraspora sp. AC03309]